MPREFADCRAYEQVRGDPCRGGDLLRQRGGSQRAHASHPRHITSLIANEPEAEVERKCWPVPVIQRGYLYAYIGGRPGGCWPGRRPGAVHSRRLRARPRIARRRRRAAHEVALERLDRLGARLGTKRRFGPSSSSCPRSIPRVPGARFAFNSLELTTEEWCSAARGFPSRRCAGFVLARWKGGCGLRSGEVRQGLAIHGRARGAWKPAFRIVESTRPRPSRRPGSCVVRRSSLGGQGVTTIFSGSNGQPARAEFPPQKRCPEIGAVRGDEDGPDPSARTRVPTATEGGESAPPRGPPLRERGGLASDYRSSSPSPAGRGRG